MSWSRYSIIAPLVLGIASFTFCFDVGAIRLQRAVRHQFPDPQHNPLFSIAHGRIHRASDGQFSASDKRFHALGAPSSYHGGEWESFYVCLKHSGP